jgi:FSR family fosmidomycin resistance protein-like MFS transporter
MDAGKASSWGANGTALLLGLIHALVDTASMAILYYEYSLERLEWEQILLLIIGYNVLAFGLQAPLGWLADRLGGYRAFAAIGLGLSAAAIALSTGSPWAAATTVGLGNAMFHVGAGAVVLRAGGGRATALGIFVGPGAAGVAAGIYLGLAGFPGRWMLTGAIAACATLTAVMRPVERPVPPPADGKAMARPIVVLSILLLCASVAVRALLGGGIASAWRIGHMGLVLAATAVGGKMLGGLLGDRAGWRVVGVGALAATAPLIWWVGRSPAAAVGASLLVQLTMAVTLAGVYVAIPDRPGLAFGLPCLALLIGSAPGLARAAEWISFDPAAWMLPAAAAGVVTIFIGLSLLPRRA